MSPVYLQMAVCIYNNLGTLEQLFENSPMATVSPHYKIPSIPSLSTDICGVGFDIKDDSSSLKGNYSTETRPRADIGNAFSDSGRSISLEYPEYGVIRTACWSAEFEADTGTGHPLRVITLHLSLACGVGLGPTIRGT